MTGNRLAIVGVALVLGLVLVDAAQNKFAWGHWEQGDTGPLAVFGYSVPRQKSHYEVRYCCVAAAYGLQSNAFTVMSPAFCSPMGRR